MTDPKSAAELTPEARVLVSRARRSFLFSIGLLLVGFIVIGGALVYKSMQPSGNGTPVASGTGEYALAAVKVPAGADVVSAVAAGGLLTVTYKAGQATSIRIFDGKTGEMVREVPVVGE